LFDLVLILCFAFSSRKQVGVDTNAEYDINAPWKPVPEKSKK
jgi:hypothetical protein